MLQELLGAVLKPCCPAAVLRVRLLQAALLLVQRAWPSWQQARDQAAPARQEQCALYHVLHPGAPAYVSQCTTASENSILLAQVGWSGSVKPDCVQSSCAGRLMSAGRDE